MRVFEVLIFFTVIPLYRYTVIIRKTYLNLTVIPQSIYTANGKYIVVVKMSKRKTSINISDKLWRSWTKFAIDKTGSSRKTSEILEDAIKEYMERHRNDVDKNDS